MHKFVLLFVGCLVVAWLVGGFDFDIVFVVLGNARPLLLSPCNTHASLHDVDKLVFTMAQTASITHAWALRLYKLPNGICFAARTCMHRCLRCDFQHAPYVLHRKCHKRLAPPRNTQNKAHLKSAQTTVNRHSSHTKNRAPANEQPKIQVSQHQQAQQPCTPSAYLPPAIITQTRLGHCRVL